MKPAKISSTEDTQKKVMAIHSNARMNVTVRSSHT